jgi:RNA polymerase sigma-70 factor (ECF subfamily)
MGTHQRLTGDAPAPAAANDEARWRELIEQYRAYLLSVAEHRLDGELRTKVAPSDLVQETFLDAFRAAERFTGQSAEELRLWLRRLLLNNVVDAVRRYRVAEKRRERKESAADQGSLARMRVANVVDSRLTPHAAAVQGETARALIAALGRLPLKYQQVLRLRHHDALTFAEIAARVGLSENAARKLWVRAIERLQLEFEVTP